MLVRILPVRQFAVRKLPNPYCTFVTMREWPIVIRVVASLIASHV